MVMVRVGIVGTERNDALAFNLVIRKEPKSAITS